MNDHFKKLLELIDTFNNERTQLDLKRLQDLRENLSLTLFYLSSDFAKAISNFDSKEYERRRFYAEREEFYRNSLDDKTKKNHNVADSERKARLDAKQIDDETVTALRQKERVRIMINATNQILNSISGRITQLNK